MQICQKWKLLSRFYQRNVLCQNQPFPHYPRQSRPQNNLHKAISSPDWHCFYVSWSCLLLLLFCPESQVIFILIVCFACFEIFQVLNTLVIIELKGVRRIFDVFRKFHSIRKLRLNLIDIQVQFIYINFFLYKEFLHQAFNIAFQIYYDELGIENIFEIWWLSNIFENFGKTL